jgi:hypothetical protein
MHALSVLSEASEPLLLEEPFEIGPQLIEYRAILVPLVSLKGQHLHVPLADLLGYRDVLEVQVVAADTQE